jgi:hypothetical protein
MATSLLEHCCSPLEADGAAVDSIGTAIFQRLSNWLDDADSAEAVSREFEAIMSRSAQKLRGRKQGSISERHVGTDVIPLRINPDGSLFVSSFLQLYLLFISLKAFLFPSCCNVFSFCAS